MDLLRICASEGNFDSEAKCIAQLEKMRWPRGVCCPACGNRRISHIHAKGKTGKSRHLYQCLQKSCRYQFSATTGTIFHDSHLPLRKWFLAAAMISNSPENTSTTQLRDALGIQYKTAHYVAQRLRTALQNGTIEVHRAQTDRVNSTPVLAEFQHVSVDPGQAPVLDGNNLPLIAKRAGGKTIANTLNTFTGLAQIALRSPLFFANYILDKVSIGT